MVDGDGFGLEALGDGEEEHEDDEGVWGKFLEEFDEGGEEVDAFLGVGLGLGYFFVHGCCDFVGDWGELGCRFDAGLEGDYEDGDVGAVVV